MVRRALVLFLSATCLASSGCGSQTPPPKLSNANRLVDIGRGAHVSPPNADIRAVQAHLDSLARRCGESEGAVTASVAAALKLLIEHGIRESAVALTAALDAASSLKRQTSSCSDVLVALLVQLESGRPL
jgi:hypothetical protein